MNGDPHLDVGDVQDLGDLIRFEIVDHEPGIRVLHVMGELDTLTSPQLQSRMSRQLADVDRLVVDLTAVTFLGSAGLAVLVAAKAESDERGCRLLLVPGSRVVERALEATGLLHLFTVADDVEQALAASR